MNEVVKDIEVIESALKAIVHGLPADKFDAIVELEKLLIQKKDTLHDFEAMLEGYHG